MKRRGKIHILRYIVGLIIVLFGILSVFGIKNSLDGYLIRKEDLNNTLQEKEYITKQLNALQIDVLKRRQNSERAEVTGIKVIEETKRSRIDIRGVGPLPKEDREFTENEVLFDVIKQ